MSLLWKWKYRNEISFWTNTLSFIALLPCVQASVWTIQADIKQKKVKFLLLKIIGLFLEDDCISLYFCCMDTSFLSLFSHCSSVCSGWRICCYYHFINSFFRPKRKTKDKLENFECGIESDGNARLPFSIKYFLTAILFVLFDVEVIFLYPWAVNFKELGMVGFTQMALFLGYFLLDLYISLKRGF